MVWLPLIGDTLLAVGLPALARRLPYRRGFAALTAIGVLGTACWLWCLVLLAAVFTDRLGYLDARGGLTAAPASLKAVPLLATAAAAGTLLTAVVRMAVLAVRHTRELAHAERLARLPLTGDVIELADPDPYACAVGGLTGGRIAITTGLRRCLTDAEQAAVLAHERAHLDGRHHWYRIAAAWCAAVCPPLFRLPALIEQSCERAADEAAALAIGDRRLLARALGKTALATARTRRGASHAGSPGLLHGGVPERMAALLDDSPPPDRTAALVAVIFTSAIAVMVLASVHAGTDCVAMLNS
ncbi:M56 family metallopeptidase [Frankia sp. AiPa1]|uniref:M56 family metallopeptidase n=1 Tax=Frankia sp. AiPa1 TaxID=573492 RepID=UPI00202B9EDC|nr:M56 family metallopeptidase [Frankia sp. AiPa1]MCL9758549.1 M56 family metallopeptidase [Frankia sp. AiPa1]